MNEGHIQGPRNQLSEEYLKHGDFLSLVIILNVRLNAHEMVLLCHCFVIDTGLEKLLHVSSPSSVCGIWPERDGIFLRRPQSELTSRRHLTSYFNVLSAREFPHFRCSRDVLSQVFIKDQLDNAHAPYE